MDREPPGERGFCVRALALAVLLPGCGGTPDLSVLTQLEGEHHHVFNGVGAYDTCRMSWVALGVASVEPCEACDLVFEVELAFVEESGDCVGGYGYPRGEDYGELWGFTASFEDQGPVVGPVESGVLDWGSGSVLGPATASAEAEVTQEDPLVMAWEYSWRDPWGYYYDHSWYGSTRLQ